MQLFKGDREGYKKAMKTGDEGIKEILNNALQSYFWRT